MGEEVLDADGEVVVGVEQAGGAGDDAVAVVVGVGGEGYVVLVFVGDHGGHGVGAGAVHADAAVPVAGHEAEGGVYVVVEDFRWGDCIFRRCGASSGRRLRRGGRRLA